MRVICANPPHDPGKDDLVWTSRRHVGQINNFHWGRCHSMKRSGRSIAHNASYGV